MNVSAWFAVMLVLSTIDYRIDLGPLSISLVEPVAVVGALIILGRKLRRGESLALKNPLFLVFAVLTVWALLIRPFSPDWKHGLSDIRDWIVPTLTLVALLNVEQPRPRTWIAIFAFVVLALSGFGILQHFVNGLRPFVKDTAGFKMEIIPDDAGNLNHASFAAAFFSTANSMGLFLTMGIPVVVAWLQSLETSFGRIRYLILLVPLVALYFTYSRFSIAVTCLIGFVLLLHYVLRSTNRFVQGMVSAVIVGMVGFVIGINVLPYEILRTFWWRVALWDISGVTLLQRPLTLLAGNGMDYFAAMSFYFQPHNLYIFIFLEYGIIGLTLLLALIVWLIWQGLQWRAQGAFQQMPLLVPLWLALLGQFAIGFLETTWLTLNMREVFVLCAAIFVWLAPAPAPLRFPARRVVVTPEPVQPSPYAS